MNQTGCTEHLSEAFQAVNRNDNRRACWARYVRAQGGLMLGRNYRLRIGTVPLELEGRYETRERGIPLAVFDVAAPEVWHLSSRQQWRPKGTWPRAAVHTAATPVPAQFLIEEGQFVANPAHAAWLADQEPGGASIAAASPTWTRVNNCTNTDRAINWPCNPMSALSATPSALAGTLKTPLAKKRQIDAPFQTR